jgi:hypothetical protein
MPLNMRTPGGTATPATSQPITRSFAGLVLAALVILFALRHLFGSVHAEVGVR